MTNSAVHEICLTAIGLFVGYVVFRAALIALGEFMNLKEEGKGEE